jgi:hypothetical protein
MEIKYRRKGYNNREEKAILFLLSADFRLFQGIENQAGNTNAYYYNPLRYIYTNLTMTGRYLTGVAICQMGTKQPHMKRTIWWYRDSKLRHPVSVFLAVLLLCALSD